MQVEGKSILLPFYAILREHVSFYAIISALSPLHIHYLDPLVKVFIHNYNILPFYAFLMH